MIDDKLHIKLFANCIPVKGVKRSVICDLQRGEVKLIPNDLYTILIGKSIKIGGVKSKFNNEYDDIIDEYFTFLLDEELAFTTDTPELFPEMSKEWYEPAQINNAIIDVSKNSNYDISKILIQLSDLNCKNIQIRFFRKVKITEIKSILIFLDSQESFITSLDFIFPFIKEDKELVDHYVELISRYKRIHLITIYNCDDDKLIESTNKPENNIVLIKTNITSKNHCGIISAQLFTINIKNYTESLVHNSCLNRKISIDSNGDIKNCPSMLENFGNIETATLKEALNHDNFKKNWEITKDQITICKDCEFRYICTDCRSYVENPEDNFSKPLKCGYDPYTNKWSEWSVNPLKQKVIKHYSMENLVNKIKQ